MSNEQAALNGQVALITGATRGIGKAIALELGKQGAVVAGTATSDAGAQAIGAYLAAAGIKGAGFALNDSQIVPPVIDCLSWPIM